MTSAFGLFGAAFGGAPRLAGRGGVFQRISITAGFAWLSVPLRTLISVLPVFGQSVSRCRSYSLGLIELP
ncbi:MAG TPA: hypothetical protein VNV17_14960 [Solirubrobacteraceae bacterium]|nr:hypothetical protein [Solirubrobacteraceae bacterium]